MLQSADQELFRVCYACHCSYRELEHFIEYLKPRQIEACVIPQNMEETNILQLLRVVCRWGNGSADAPVLTVSRKVTKNGMSTEVATFCSTVLAEQQNATTSVNVMVAEEADGGNMVIEGGHDDAEIYRLIAEDLKPKIGDPDADIKQKISLAFLESAVGLSTSLV